MNLKKPLSYYLLSIFITGQLVGCIAVVFYWIINGSHIVNITVMICFLMQIPFGAIGLWSLLIYNRQVLMIYALINIVIGLYSSLICIYFGNKLETLDCVNRNAYDIKRVNYCKSAEKSLFTNIIFITYSMPCIYYAIKFISFDLLNPVWIYPLNLKNNVTDIDKYMKTINSKALEKRGEINI
ncbi:hypothetical protein BCR36DRAFT_359859 [Piromyces finnis]|uniref:Uncharacterized protein n=1 Tax=Piromyces finnis TaxID=1754191 RepID=A0A1Y1V1G1_9FUNG|nr:hypothetical protein BCR36DRAFT_359859 [Piromyces finnis]|eukprot:ORX44350.1 hypothetical protein BCR36DRAFT_359859 [Piromyces finnis]